MILSVYTMLLILRHFPRFVLLSIIWRYLTVAHDLDSQQVRETKADLDNLPLPSWLPRTSHEFKEKFLCSEDQASEHMSEDAFVRSVLSARHTTWTDGWEVPIANASKSASDSTQDGTGKFYARVFDLLNWARLQNLLPETIAVDKVCHKGMETVFGYISRETNMLPQTPNRYIPDETWTKLWTTCHKKLNSQSRTSTSCIDIPAMVVSNPDPPWKVNNPCHYEFRMIDGAHRLCLRKYLLSLLEGELLDGKQELAAIDVNADSSVSDQIKTRTAMLQNDMEQIRYGYFFILNQTTFETMLTDLDPHASWAVNEDILMKDITVDFKDDWARWMKKVMDHVNTLGTQNADANLVNNL